MVYQWYLNIKKSTNPELARLRVNNSVEGGSTLVPQPEIPQFPIPLNSRHDTVVIIGGVVSSTLEMRRNGIAEEERKDSVGAKITFCLVESWILSDLHRFLDIIGSMRDLSIGMLNCI